MDELTLRPSTWQELDGLWQTLVQQEFHADYIGIGEAYAGVYDVPAKLAAMGSYAQEGLSAWAAWSGAQLTGLLAGKLNGKQLVLYDLFISSNFRRQGLGRRLVELAVESSNASTISAEVNGNNAASAALFESLNFQKVLVSQWFVRQA